MLLTLETSLADVPTSAVAELRAFGIVDADIAAAFALQQKQRSCGVPVLPLAVICGARPLERGMKTGLSHTASRLIGTKPRARSSRGGTHITGRPVWANSVRTGDAAEAEFVRPVSFDQLKELRRAIHLMFDRARDLAAEARQGGELTPEQHKLTLFTRSCRDMLLRIVDELRYRKGWCVPSYETLMRWTRLGRRTVKYSLDRLRELGLLEWIRRYDYTRDSQHGARSEQTSNLYRCHVPKWIGKMVGLYSPVPEDEAQRRADSLEEHADMLASVGAIERRRLMPDDPAQRAALILAAERSAARHAPDAYPRGCKNGTAPHTVLYSISTEKRSCPSRATIQP